MNNGIEKKILEKMATTLVASKSELISSLSKDANISKDIVVSAAKSLISKGFLTPVYSSETTYAITQKGMRESNG